MSGLIPPDRTERAKGSPWSHVGRSYPAPPVTVEDVLDAATEALEWQVGHGRTVDRAVWEARIEARRKGLQMPLAYRFDTTHRLLVGVFTQYAVLGTRRAVRVMLVADLHPEGL